MGRLSSMQDLLIDEIRDLYYAEKQIVQALPKMVEAASDKELKKAFQEHLQQTKNQVQRLDQVFQHLGIPARGKVCHAMLGILEEGKEMIEEDGNPDVKDAGLISSAQRVEHYEIAGYGCVRTYAEELGMKEVAGLLQQTLDEEKSTDSKLTQLAERRLNREAIGAGRN